MIFLDSSFIIAYSNEYDSFHEKAIGIAKDLAADKYGTPVITDYVFDEVMTCMLSRTKDLRKAVETGERLLDTTLLLRIESTVFDESWKIFKTQRNHKLSFTDCSILAACKMNGVDKIVTFDRGLREEGKLNVVN